MAAQLTDTDISFHQISASENLSHSDYIGENNTILSEKSTLSSKVILANSFLENLKLSSANGQLASYFNYSSLEGVGRNIVRNSESFKQLKDLRDRASKPSNSSLNFINDSSKLKRLENNCRLSDSVGSDSYTDQNLNSLKADSGVSSESENLKNDRYPRKKGKTMKSSFLVLGQKRYNLRLKKKGDQSLNFSACKKVDRRNFKQKTSNYNEIDRVARKRMRRRRAKNKKDNSKFFKKSQKIKNQKLETKKPSLLTAIIPLNSTIVKSLEDAVDNLKTELEKSRYESAADTDSPIKRAKQLIIKTSKLSASRESDSSCSENSSEEEDGSKCTHSQTHDDRNNLCSRSNVSNINDTDKVNKPTTSSLSKTSIFSIKNTSLNGSCDISGLSESTIFREVTDKILRTAKSNLDMRPTKRKKKIVRKRDPPTDKSKTKRKLFLPDEDIRFDINGRPYQTPVLAEPARWISKHLYNFLIGKLEPVFNMEARLKSEEVVVILCSIVKKVQTQPEGDVFSLLPLKKILFEYDICKTVLEFYTFINRFTPFDFQVRVLPLGGFFLSSETRTKEKLFDPLLPA